MYITLQISKERSKTLSICGKCDFSCLEKSENGYQLRCTKSLEPQKQGMYCTEFFECEKMAIDVEIEPKLWEQIETLAKQVKISPNDFASKIIVQRMQKERKENEEN